ncbi:hypothetical protein O181_016475 [Austropuccinia psidii MF-1]|uniref:Uncharacterized protein n=1 Tax=Austropuccinia psidii MF-1 TaxID=1389203 RepID=A0A9Q3C5W9_9BASI|nr:hypothetical protein [Austropuccinia psidii MF-1]
MLCNLTDIPYGKESINRHHQWRREAGNVATIFFKVPKFCQDQLTTIIVSSITPPQAAQTPEIQPKMLKYYLLLVAFTITFVSVRADRETCAYFFSINHFDKTNSSVFCSTALGINYQCSKTGCYVENLPLDKGLFFTDCYQKRANRWIKYVWPEQYTINHALNHVAISTGQKSWEQNSTRSKLTENVSCPLDNKHPENYKLLVCNSCGNRLPPQE